MFYYLYNLLSHHHYIIQRLFISRDKDNKRLRFLRFYLVKENIKIEGCGGQNLIFTNQSFLTIVNIFIVQNTFKDKMMCS